MSDVISKDLKTVLKGLRLSRMLDTLPERLTLARQQICGNVDIMTDRTRDQKGDLCDAVSVAFAFETGAASLGGRMPFTPEDDCPGFDAGGCEK